MNQLLSAWGQFMSIALTRSVCGWRRAVTVGGSLAVTLLVPCRKVPNRDGTHVVTAVAACPRSPRLADKLFARRGICALAGGRPDGPCRGREDDVRRCTPTEDDLVTANQGCRGGLPGAGELTR